MYDVKYSTDTRQCPEDRKTCQEIRAERDRLREEVECLRNSRNAWTEAATYHTKVRLDQETEIDRLRAALEKARLEVCGIIRFLPEGEWPGMVGSARNALVQIDEALRPDPVPEELSDSGN